MISVSVVGENSLSDGALKEKIEVELVQWFGEKRTWRHLKTYRINEALPQHFNTSEMYKSLKINEFMFRCGDYTAYPSLNAAMKTGREVADYLT